MSLSDYYLPVKGVLDPSETITDDGFEVRRIDNLRGMLAMYNERADKVGATTYRLVLMRAYPRGTISAPAPTPDGSGIGTTAHTAYRLSSPRCIITAIAFLYPTDKSITFSQSPFAPASGPADTFIGWSGDASGTSTAVTKSAGTSELSITANFQASGQPSVTDSSSIHPIPLQTASSLANPCIINQFRTIIATLVALYLDTDFTPESSWGEFASYQGWNLNTLLSSLGIGVDANITGTVKRWWTNIPERNTWGYTKKGGRLITDGVSSSNSISLYSEHVNEILTVLNALTVPIIPASSIINFSLVAQSGGIEAYLSSDTRDGAPQEIDSNANTVPDDYTTGESDWATRTWGTPSTVVFPATPISINWMFFGSSAPGRNWRDQNLRITSHSGEITKITRKHTYSVEGGGTVDRSSFVNIRGKIRADLTHFSTGTPVVCIKLSKPRDDGDPSHLGVFDLDRPVDAEDKYAEWADAALSVGGISDSPYLAEDIGAAVAEFDRVHGWKISAQVCFVKDIVWTYSL